MSTLRNASAMFLSTTNMISPLMIDITSPAPRQRPTKAVPKRKPRTEAQKAARKMRDTKKREVA